MVLCHDCEPCKNGWTDEGAVWKVESGGNKEPCIRWGCTLAPPGKYCWTFSVWRQWGRMSNYFNYLLLSPFGLSNNNKWWRRCWTTEPVQMPFGTWTWVVPRKHVLDGGVHWWHQANMTELSVQRQSVSNYFDHVTVITGMPQSYNYKLPRLLQQNDGDSCQLWLKRLTNLDATWRGCQFILTQLCRVQQSASF